MKLNISNKTGVITVVLLLLILTGCKKYLDQKSDQKLVIASSLQDLQMLLDNWSVINQNDGSAAEVSADDYYITTSDYNQISQYLRNVYTWQKESLFSPGNNNEWAKQYLNIYWSNIVLDNIDKITTSEEEQVEKDNIKGQALFLRANSFLHLVLTFCLAYDKETAQQDLGLPLRLESDFEIPSVRASVQTTYDQIIKDLKASVDLLPVSPLHVLRSSRPAALGLLARCYISMREYDSAGKYSGLCLQLNNNLMDYNQNGPGVDLNAPFPFTIFNPEQLHVTAIPYPSPVRRGFVDTALFNSYKENDLRKKLFFSGPAISYFKGNYNGRDNLFDGIATDEMYLTYAECLAREGNKDTALSILNSLLVKRYDLNSFIPAEAADAKSALAVILGERRKELLFRGLRWMDIKRLNKEEANIILSRNIDGQNFILLPNDQRYALPIPEDVIAVSGMLQNPR
jgi:hypothetical protein